MFGLLLLLLSCFVVTVILYSLLGLGTAHIIMVIIDGDMLSISPFSLFVDFGPARQLVNFQ